MTRSIASWFVGLLAIAAPGCQSGSAENRVERGPEIASRVVIFRIDSAQVASDTSGGATADPVASRILARCKESEAISQQLTAAVQQCCGASHVELLALPFRSAERDLDTAWQKTPRPDFAVSISIRPEPGKTETRTGSTVLGTIGWLLCGIPGFVIDDEDCTLPVAIDVSVWDHSPREDLRAAKSFSLKDEKISTDYFDRNQFISLPYVYTILIPPHFVSSFGEDDTDAAAEAVLQAALANVAQGIAQRIRELEGKAKPIG